MAASKYPPLYKSFVGKRSVAAKTAEEQALPFAVSSGKRHAGIFTGRAVEVRYPEAIQDLHKNGCFGVGALTKSTPLCLKKDNQGQENESLLLFAEEAFFLQYFLNCLEIRRTDQSLMTDEECLLEFTRIHPQFLTYFAVYTYLRSKNWVIKSGIKFGGDYLAYRRGPEFFHATYLAVVRTEGDPTPVQLQSLHRVAQTSGKEVLFLEVSPRPDINQISEYLKNQFRDFQVTEVIPQRFILK